MLKVTTGAAKAGTPATTGTGTGTAHSRAAEKADPIWLQEGTFGTVQACSDRGSLGDVLGWWITHECRLMPWGTELWVLK